MRTAFDSAHVLPSATGAIRFGVWITSRWLQELVQGDSLRCNQFFDDRDHLYLRVPENLSCPLMLGRWPVFQQWKLKAQESLLCEPEERIGTTEIRGDYQRIKVAEDISREPVR